MIKTFPYFLLFGLISIILLFVVGGCVATIGVMIGLENGMNTAIATGFWILSVKKAWNWTKERYNKRHNKEELGGKK